MLNISIQRKVLSAMIVTAAKADIRYYLNGVFVEVTERDVILVSTDGHRMGIYRMDRPADAPSALSFIVPRHFIETAIRCHPARSKDSIALMFDPEANSLTAKCEGGLSVGSRAIEGRFPAWRKVVALTEAEAANYNQLYLADFAKVFDLLAGGRSRYRSPVVTVRQQGMACGLVTNEQCASYLGVVMPMRSGEEPIQALPGWAVETKTEPEEIAA